MKRFSKGVRLPIFERRSLLTTQIMLLEQPPYVSIPYEAGGTVLVKEGDEILSGARLVEEKRWDKVPTYSSVFGRVSKITECDIRIESIERDRLSPSIQVRVEIPKDADTITELIREGGIVNMDGDGAPIHVGLAQSLVTKVDTLIINSCHAEPFLTADQLLVINFATEILKGVELLRLACGAKRAVIAVSQDQYEVAEILNSKNYNLKLKAIETVVLPLRYPQGESRTLAETITGKKIMWHKAVSSVGAHVENIATAFACYEAVYLGKPLFERVVTVGGPCVADPKNMWVRNGTPTVQLISACKGFLRDPECVVFGGPMSGRAIEHLELPVSLEVNAVLGLPSDFTFRGAEEQCIRCGRCVDVCPEDLLPETLVRMVRQGNIEMADQYGIEGCTDCGACTYVCPSNIPLSEVIVSGQSPFKVPLPKVPGSNLEVVEPGTFGWGTYQNVELVNEQPPPAT